MLRIRVLLLIFAIGCGRIGFEPSDGGSGGGDGRGGDGGGGDGGGIDAAVSCTPTTFACADGDLGSGLGMISSGTTVGQGDDHTGSCGGNGEVDVAFHWFAPSAARYVIDTYGASFDTVLYVRAACGGTQIACNDDTLVSGNTSSLTLDLAECRELLIVVDGVFGGGAYRLNARDKCPGTKVGSALGAMVASGSNLGWGDSYTSSCGGSTEDDVVVSWTAPATGTFRFTTAGTSFDSVLSARASCTGSELMCNDDDPGGGNHSTFQLALTAGEPIVLVIDSVFGGGSYQLGISQL